MVGVAVVQAWGPCLTYLFAPDFEKKIVHVYTFTLLIYDNIANLRYVINYHFPPLYILYKLKELTESKLYLHQSQSAERSCYIERC